ncbi:MAG: phosphoribosyltransferase [Spirochaetota bacterium]
MIFKDRSHAGKVLAGLLNDYASPETVALGLPNGGIPVGIEIARELGCKFDLLFVSKITPSFNTETGYGSVSESGAITINEQFVKRYAITPENVKRDTDRTREKISRRMKTYRIAEERPQIKGRTVIIVDDGIASGYTMINAIQTVKDRGADKVIAAVPTAPQSTYEYVQSKVDGIVCPDIRDVSRFAVADAYENWHDISFDEAMTLLKEVTPDR